MTKVEWLKQNGFDENGVTYCVFGDNTFAIKEELKELGCKFSPILKWHAGMPLDVPEGYGMIAINFNEVMQWSEEKEKAFFFDSAQSILDQRILDLEGPNLSEYVGVVGERLRNRLVILKSIRGCNTAYGYSNIYTFIEGENELVWFTAKELEFEKGDELDLTGTVKKHETYRGVRLTHLSRCIIKKRGE